MMPQRTLGRLLAVGVLVGMAHPARATVLYGTVMTAGGSPAPVGKARVALFDPMRTTVVETRTDWWGRYRLDAPPGTWQVGASLRGLEWREVVVNLGATDVRQDFQLGPETAAGTWETIGDTSPEYPAATNSGSMLADGTFLVCHDTRDAVRFDPVTRLKTFPPDSNDQQGCVALTLLGTGELLFVGGQDTGDFTDATRRVKTFNTWTSAWTIQPSMNEQRWYPSLARLEGGDMLVCGGGQRPDAARTPTCELWESATRMWSYTAPMALSSEYSPMALLHEGEVLKNWFPPELYDPSTATWRPTGRTVQDADRSALYPDHCDHSLAVLRNGEAVIAGILPASSTGSPVMAEHYDPCAGTWRLGGNSEIVRSRPELAPLPDGRLFVCGGKLEEAAPGVFTNSQGYTRLADLYDPETESWREMAEMRIQREYHATTVLLPDARVLITAGTGLAGQSTSPDNGIDAWSPPYLARGPRPRIDAISSSDLVNGQSFSIDASFATGVTSIVLIGLQAATHYIDGAVPRRLALPFAYSAPGRFDARVPAGSRAAPDGWYQLFLMTDDVPSEARLVRISAAPIAPAADEIGGALRVEKTPDDVALQWRQAPLNPSQYNVYRSTVAADLSLVGSRIASEVPLTLTKDEVFRDPGAALLAAPDLYFYRVLGRACDGSPIIP